MRRAGPAFAGRSSRSVRKQAVLPRRADGEVWPPANPARCGMTLFEVLLALAIFLGAFAAISQIIDIGRQASVESQLESEAVLRAQTKLAEVVAGIEPLSAVQGQTFEDDPSWTWALTLGDGPHLDLIALSVTVEHVRPGGSIDAAFVLNRLVRDPQLFIDAAANAALAEEG